MDAALSEDVLRAAHCWEAADRVPGRPAMTSFKRRMRLHQSRWREANGHPIGTQPIAPRPADTNVRLVGSRLPLATARDSGANFVTAGALAAMHARSALVERHQMFDSQRSWADLLWSPTMSFNLFGDLAADLALADRAVHAWWPDVPGTVVDVRFAHSPGRLDPAYLVDWGAAFVLDLGDGTRGIIAVNTKYADHTFRQAPKPARLPRYTQVTERSGAFARDWLDAVNGTELLHVWLAHALVLSMLQHPGGEWAWGRHAVVHPAGNVDQLAACTAYADLLVDDATFTSITLEDLLAADVVPASSRLRERYLPPT